VMGSAGIVTGKIYEYMASGRPIVALGQPGGEADGLLQESSGGMLFDYTDTDGLAEALDKHYRAWDSGSPMTGAPADRLQPYSRKSQALELARLLDTCTTDISDTKSQDS